ncbi:MAG: CDP-glucose 4,6-dehydratase [Planctomycetales bacterium]
MNDSFWNRRRVMVTGATGFKGAWLCLWLQELGADVLGYSLDPPTDPSLFEAAGVGAGMISRIGDVREREDVRAALDEHRPEVVFHLAAQPLVRRSYVEPAETFDVNVLGTVSVLEAVRAADSVRSVVVVTTDKCYENQGDCWPMRESDPLGGHDPYSASKACCELVVQAYRRSFFATTHVGLASARAGNVIGGGDWAEDRLVPDIERAIRRGGAVSVRFPEAVRPWQHVLEPLAGYLQLAERLWAAPQQSSGAWNFGPPSEQGASVAECIDGYIGHRGAGRWIHDPPAVAVAEAAFLTLDSSKARRLLQWRSLLTLDEALALTAEWYRTAETASQQQTLRRFTCGQIESYQTRRRTMAAPARRAA